MPQSVRHGKQRPVVHPVQVEEGLLQIRRLIQSHDWRTRLNDVKIYDTFKRRQRYGVLSSVFVEVQRRRGRGDNTAAESDL